MNKVETPPLEGKKILVTGAAGFVGRHLVRRLLERGASVTGLDRHQAAGEGWPGQDPRLQFLQLDLGAASVGDIESCCRGQDYLFHLAAVKHREARGDVTACLRGNIEGSYRLLGAAASQRIKRTVFFSSLYVYGRPRHAPFTEDDMPLPDTVYGISKLAGERLLGHFRRENFLDYCILRCFFIYGPLQFLGTGYPSVIVKNFERLLRGEPALINGDGQQALDYVYVDDLVDASLLALNAAPGEVFNVGGGGAITVSALTNLMLSIAESGAAPVFAPADETAGTTRAGRIEKIQQQLQWRPRVTLEQGLRATWQWLKDRHPDTATSDVPR